MKSIILAFCLAISAITAHAEELKIADGSSSGIYKQFTKEIQDKLTESGSDITLVSVESSGAIQNITKLLDNKASLALAHSDVLFFRSKTEDLSNVKTLMALFPEDVNIVTLNKPYKPQGGMFDFAKKGIEIETLSDLANLPVGAAGGGYITAQVIRLQSEVSFTVTRYESGKDVLPALQRGEIAAAIFVGAAPLPNLENLDSSYKLVSIGESARDRLKAVYHPSTITYDKMSPTPVATVAADCLLLTRNYKSEKMSTSLLKLRDTIIKALPDLKETTDFHRGWQSVDPSNHGKWDWYDGGR